jgi:hypothetical protein
MAGVGHEDQFWPPGLSGGCRLGKETFAGMGGKEEDAPEAVVSVTAIEWGSSTPTRSFTLTTE